MYLLQLCNVVEQSNNVVPFSCVTFEPQLVVGFEVVKKFDVFIFVHILYIFELHLFDVWKFFYNVDKKLSLM